METEARPIATSRAERFLVAALIAGAALARLAFIAATDGRTPVFDKYFWLARRLAAAGWLPQVVFADCPLYVYLVGLLHEALGLDEPGVRVLQALLAPVTVFLGWRLARSLAGPVAGAVAGLVLALSPPLILYDTQPMPFVWINFSNAAALSFLFAWARTRRHRHGALAGLGLGVSALLRPNVLPWLPLLLGWMLLLGRGAWKRAAGSASLLALACALAIAPVAFLNARAGGGFVPVTASGGLNLFGGNNPWSNPLGASALPLVLHVQTYIVGAAIAQPITAEHIAYRRVAAWLSGRDLSPREASGFWEREALAYVRRSPGAFARGLLAKLRHFFSAYEAHDTDSAFARWQLFGRLPVAFFGAAWGTAAVGLVASARRWRELLPLHALLLVYLANAVTFYVSSRLRLPALLPLAVFAGLGARTLLDLHRGRRTRLLAAALGGAAAGAALCALPTAASSAHHRRASAYVREFHPASESFLRGERAEALRRFAAAVALDGGIRGMVAAFLEPYAADPAVGSFLRDLPATGAQEADPTSARTAALRASALRHYRAGDHRGAVEELTALLALAPLDWDARYGRSQAWAQLGAWQDASRELELAFDLGKKFQPGLHRLYYEMGLAASRAGDTARARERLRRALFVRPDYPEAARLLAALEPPAH